jgi:Flp pilus assembly protein TadG
MNLLASLRQFARARDGAAAAEFGLVLPIFVTLLMGSVWVGMLTWANNSLQAAVQTAARCAAVNTSQCSTPTEISNFALANYTGPGISPVFTSGVSDCGQTVTGQADFNMNIVPGIGTIPLSATACYPTNAAE